MAGLQSFKNYHFRYLLLQTLDFDILQSKLISRKIRLAGKLLHFHTVWLTYFTGNINKKLGNAQYVRIIVFTTVYPSTWFSIFSVFFRVLVRAVSYTIHGLIPASCVFADRYNREEVVASLGREINLNPPLTLGQLPDTSEELLKLDQVKDTQF